MAGLSTQELQKEIDAYQAHGRDTYEQWDAVFCKPAGIVIPFGWYTEWGQDLDYYSEQERFEMKIAENEWRDYATEQDREKSYERDQRLDDRDYEDWHWEDEYGDWGDGVWDRDDSFAETKSTDPVDHGEIGFRDFVESTDAD